MIAGAVAAGVAGANWANALVGLSECTDVSAYAGALVGTLFAAGTTILGGLGVMVGRMR